MAKIPGKRTTRKIFLETDDRKTYGSIFSMSGIEGAWLRVYTYVASDMVRDICHKKYKSEANAKRAWERIVAKL